MCISFSCFFCGFPVNGKNKINSPQYTNTHTHTLHSSLYCAANNIRCLIIAEMGQLMPPHKTSRAHICSAFNQCVSPLDSFFLSRSLLILKPIHSSPYPFPIPFSFPFTLSSSSSSFTLESRWHRLHEQAHRYHVLPHLPHTLVHTCTLPGILIESIIHHPRPQLKRSVCIVLSKNKTPRAIFKSIGNNRSASAPDAFSLLSMFI